MHGLRLSGLPSCSPLRETKDGATGSTGTTGVTTHCRKTVPAFQVMRNRIPVSLGTWSECPKGRFRVGRAGSTNEPVRHYATPGKERPCIQDAEGEGWEARVMRRPARPGCRCVSTDVLQGRTARTQVKGVGLKPQKGRTMARKLSGAFKAVMSDESGQTMLEYIVIVVFVVIAAIIGFRLVKGTVHRSIQKASASIEQ
jgi:Flp pilus assembly pilin Flp